MSVAAEKRTEKAGAIARLRDWIKPGDTLYTVMRHRAASGMSRSIDVYGFTPANDAPICPECGGSPVDETPHESDCPRVDVKPSQNVRLVKSWYSYNIVKAGIGSWDDKREAIRVGGVGMDMGFHIVYELGAILFPDGFGCTGEGCRSSDHSNGDRDYTPHVAPRHRCGLCLDVPGKNGLGAPCYGCDGTGYVNATVSGAGHWHRDGGYALRQDWIG